MSRFKQYRHARTNHPQAAPDTWRRAARRRGDRPGGEICFTNMYRVYEALPNIRGQYHEGVYRSTSSSALASTRSGVSNPSVNQL